MKSIHHGGICTSGNKETKNNEIILGENKLKLTLNETSRKQHYSGRKKILEEDQVEQSPIMLPLDVLKRKKYASSEKDSEKNKLHSQVSNKSEENCCNHNTEKISSNKKQVMKIEFRSPLGVENHCDVKLGKDSKKNSVDNFWESILNDIEEEHSVESIQDGEFCIADKETKNNGIILAENKLKLGFSETSTKQHSSSKEQKFKEDQTQQNQILSSDMLKGKNCDASNEKQLKKNKFNSWISIKSEEYSNDSTVKCSCNKKEITKIEFHSPASVENHCDYKLCKNKESSAEKVLEPSFNDNSEENSMQSICKEEDLLSKLRVHFKVSSEISVTELDFPDDSETEFPLADSSTPNSTLETIIKAKTKHEFPVRHTDLVNLSPPKTSEFVVLPKVLDIEPIQSEFRPRPPDIISAAKNDSGISIESSLDVISTEEEEVSLNNQTNVCVKRGENTSSLDAINTDEDKVSLNKQTAASVKNTINSKKYKKPSRPCLFCKLFQSHLKQHISTKHKKHQSVKSLLKMNTTEQDRFIEGFRKQAVRNHNMNVLKLDRGDFLRERQKQSSQSEEELPVMCSAASVGVMFPMVSIEKTEYIEQHTPEFKELLSTLHLDEVGNYVKSDPIILMIGSRLFNAKRKKKDKETGTKISARTHMRLTARLYLSDLFLLLETVRGDL